MDAFWRQIYTRCIYYVIKTDFRTIGGSRSDPGGCLPYYPAPLLGSATVFVRDAVEHMTPIGTSLLNTIAKIYENQQ